MFRIFNGRVRQLCLRGQITVVPVWVICRVRSANCGCNILAHYVHLVYTRPRPIGRWMNTKYSILANRSFGPGDRRERLYNPAGTRSKSFEWAGGVGFQMPLVRRPLIHGGRLQVSDVYISQKSCSSDHCQLLNTYYFLCPGLYLTWFEPLMANQVVILLMIQFCSWVSKKHEK